MDCSFLVAPTIDLVFQCIIQNMGMTFDMFAIGMILMFAIFALMSRLDFDISLGLGFVLIWVLLAMSGGSYMLQVIFGLLVLGVALRIFMVIIAIFRQ